MLVGTSGSEGGTITGSGKLGVVVGVAAGGVGAVVVGAATGGGGGGGVTGKRTSWTVSVEVVAASSMYAELFLLNAPNGASGGRS